MSNDTCAKAKPWIPESAVVYPHYNLFMSSLCPHKYDIHKHKESSKLTKGPCMNSNWWTNDLCTKWGAEKHDSWEACR